MTKEKTVLEMDLIEFYPYTQEPRNNGIRRNCFIFFSVQLININVSELYTVLLDKALHGLLTFYFPSVISFG